MCGVETLLGRYFDWRRGGGKRGGDGPRGARAQAAGGRSRSERTPQFEREERGRRARDLVAAGQHPALPRLDSGIPKRVRSMRLLNLRYSAQLRQESGGGEGSKRTIRIKPTSCAGNKACRILCNRFEQ